MDLILRFSAQNRPASWFIRFFRWIPVSHVEAVMSGGRTLGARLVGGVKVRNVTHFSYYKDITVNVPEALWLEALSMRGWKYDILALFAFLFRIKMQKNSWVSCVEMWASLLKKYDIVVLDDTRTVDPYQLMIAIENLNKGRHGCNGK